MYRAGYQGLATERYVKNEPDVQPRTCKLLPSAAPCSSQKNPEGPILNCSPPIEVPVKLKAFLKSNLNAGHLHLWTFWTMVLPFGSEAHCQSGNLPTTCQWRIGIDTINPTEVLHLLQLAHSLAHDLPFPLNSPSLAWIEATLTVLI